MKMIDLGYKYPKSGSVEPGHDDKTHYPSFYVRKAPGELSEKSVGHMCRMEILAKVRSVSEREDGTEVELEVQEMGYVADAGKKTKEEYLKMPKEEREGYDKEQVGADKEE